MTYFRDGVQITALNLQYISDPWYLNRAVFMPKTGVPCSPNDTKKVDTLCKSGWRNGNNEAPLAYRLKPLSLIGLIPNQGLYKLEIKVLKCSRIIEDVKTGKVTLEDVSSDYKKVNLKYGLTEAAKDNISINSSVVFNGIDVTVPYFILEVVKPAKFGKSSIYKTGIEIPWAFNNSDKPIVNKLTVDAYKIVKTLLGSLNKVDLSDNCENSQVFNTHKQLRVELEYTWTFESVIEEMVNYNNAVVELRNKYNKPISYFLNNLENLNTYQDELANILSGKPSSVVSPSYVDEDKEASDYDTEITKVKGTAKAVDPLQTSED
jgi:hypothetical protein